MRQIMQYMVIGLLGSAVMLASIDASDAVHTLNNIGRDLGSAGSGSKSGPLSAITFVGGKFISKIFGRLPGVGYRLGSGEQTRWWFLQPSKWVWPSLGVTGVWLMGASENAPACQNHACEAHKQAVQRSNNAWMKPQYSFLCGALLTGVCAWKIYEWYHPTLLEAVRLLRTDLDRNHKNSMAELRAINAGYQRLLQRVKEGFAASEERDSKILAELRQINGSVVSLKGTVAAGFKKNSDNYDTVGGRLASQAVQIAQSLQLQKASVFLKLLENPRAVAMMCRKAGSVQCHTQVAC